MKNLAEEARQILLTADPWQKAAASFGLGALWRKGEVAFLENVVLPHRPSRPDRPVLLPPRNMKRRNAKGNEEKRLALLHALAHIELNAMDLAWDLLVRFGNEGLPRDFFEDWIKVGEEEALHFQLLSDRIEELGIAYGDLPAHNGLWQAAEETSYDILARLAIVPLILEARGLDVTPATIESFKHAGDEKSAAILERIYHDEIGHVRIGHKWYLYFARNVPDPIHHWRSLKEKHFRGTLKPPFNEAARIQAGFPGEYWNA